MAFCSSAEISGLAQNQCGKGLHKSVTSKGCGSVETILQASYHGFMLVALGLADFTVSWSCVHPIPILYQWYDACPLDTVVGVPPRVQALWNPWLAVSTDSVA